MRSRLSVVVVVVAAMLSAGACRVLGIAPLPCNEDDVCAIGEVCHAHLCVPIEDVDAGAASEGEGEGCVLVDETFDDPSQLLVTVEADACAPTFSDGAIALDLPDAVADCTVTTSVDRGDVDFRASMHGTFPVGFGEQVYIFPSNVNGVFMLVDEAGLDARYNDSDVLADVPPDAQRIDLRVVVTFNTVSWRYAIDGAPEVELRHEAVATDTSQPATLFADAQTFTTPTSDPPPVFFDEIVVRSNAACP